jgi:hypothetical protein
VPAAVPTSATTSPMMITTVLMVSVCSPLDRKTYALLALVPFQPLQRKTHGWHSA